MAIRTNVVPSTGTDEELKDWLLEFFNACTICYQRDAQYLAVGGSRTEAPEVYRVCSICAGLDAITLNAAKHGAPVVVRTPSGKSFHFYVLDTNGQPIARFLERKETNTFYRFNPETNEVEQTEWTEDMAVEVPVPAPAPS